MSQALRQGLRDGALLVLGAGLSAGLGIVSLRLLLSGLSAEAYGQYSLFLALSGVLGVLVLWPTHAVLRLGAEEWEESRRVGGTLGSVLGLMLLSLLGVALVCLGWREELDRFVGAPVAGPCLAFVALMGLCNLAYSLLQPTGFGGWRTLAPVLTRVWHAGLLGLVLLGAGGVLSFAQAVQLALVTMLPACFLLPWVLGRRLGGLRVEGETVARAASFAAPLLVRNLAVAAVVHLDVLLIRAYLGPVEAGRYDVAYRVAEQVVVFGFVLEFLAGPALARAAARKEPETLRAFYRLAVPPLVGAWCLGAGLLVALAYPILTLLGAHAPEASAPVLCVLAAAIAIRGASALEAPVFDAHLISRFPTFVFALGFGLNLVLDLWSLESGWGLLGPALATLAGFTLQAALRAWYVGRRFGVAAGKPYLAVLPVLVLVGVERLGGWPWALAAWVLTAGLLLASVRGGLLLSAEARGHLAAVRLPGLVRRALRLEASA